uniref:MULE transposase domain-containing protein n=1 Tax=Ditylenchus dipsaci TaxID=166011 RepID=A0A915DD41_9BILA
MVIPEGAKITHDEKYFLRCDSEVLSRYFATQRVLVWMSDFDHSLLLRTELVGFDATYKKCPRGAYQYFTLMPGLMEDFSWLACLDCGRTTESYISVMKNFFYQSAHHFESASTIAIMKIFPNLKPIRCVFHLSQTIQKWARSHGLAKYLLT